MMMIIVNFDVVLFFCTVLIFLTMLGIFEINTEFLRGGQVSFAAS